jgi:thiol-disulfide isomerase/thioredoxin
MANSAVVLLAVLAAAILIFLLSSSLRKGGKHSKKDSSTVGSEQAAPAAPPRQAGVQAASQENLEELITKFPGQTVVLFYAPWCTFCKSAKPKFQQIATSLDPNSFQFLTVDCDQSKSLADKFSPFPTIAKFRGSTVPVDKIVGDRPMADMANFAQS